MIRRATRSFWAWYERHYTLNVSIAAVLFTLQLVHLVWLTGQPLWAKIFGDPLFEVDKPWSWPLLLVDYTEIPALLSVSLVYLNELRKNGLSAKPLLYLAFLNSQWLHIFWITDEYVGNELAGQPAASSLPGWLAWVAILIDYGELPVIWDTLKRAARALSAGPRAAPLRR